MDFEIGNLVTVVAPATLFGSPLGAFGPEDVTGEVTYAHPYLSICYVIADDGQSYVDNPSLQLIEGN